MYNPITSASARRLKMTSLRNAVVFPNVVNHNNRVLHHEEEQVRAIHAQSKLVLCLP